MNAGKSRESCLLLLQGLLAWPLSRQEPHLCMSGVGDAYLSLLPPGVTVC